MAAPEMPAIHSAEVPPVTATRWPWLKFGTPILVYIAGGSSGHHPHLELELVRGRTGGAGHRRRVCARRLDAAQHEGLRHRSRREDRRLSARA